jgi:hypothetical protein
MNLRYEKRSNEGKTCRVKEVVMFETMLVAKRVIDGAR